MAESYVLKTDRNAQWQKIESRLSETATKKQIKVCRDYFLDGLDNSKHFTWSDRFRLYHNPTLEGWQKLFDEEIQEPLTDGDFRTLQYILPVSSARNFLVSRIRTTISRPPLGSVMMPIGCSPFASIGSLQVDALP